MNTQSKAADFDLEAVLPLSMIRAHTKTLDIITVTDDQLKVYRDSAFDSAQRYTGRWLRGRAFIQEPLRIPRHQALSITHRTVWDISDGEIFLRGGIVGNRMQYVKKNSHRIVIDIVLHSTSFNNCCNNCSTPETDYVSYFTGYGSCAEIPAGILMGMMKYIAFNVQNAGDISHSILNRGQVGSSIISNDAVVASGALAEWRKYGTRMVL